MIVRTRNKKYRITTCLRCHVNALTDKVCDEVISLFHGTELKYAFASMLSTNPKYHVHPQIPAKTFLELDFINQHSHPNYSISINLLMLKIDGQISINLIYGGHSRRSDKWCCANVSSCCVNGWHTESTISNVCCGMATQFPYQKGTLVVCFLVSLRAKDKLRSFIGFIK
jgi:hypothetical protein